MPELAKKVLARLRQEQGKVPPSEFPVPLSDAAEGGQAPKPANPFTTLNLGRLADLDAEEALFRTYWRTLPNPALARKKWPYDVRHYCQARQLSAEMMGELEQRCRDLVEEGQPNTALPCLTHAPGNAMMPNPPHDHGPLKDWARYYHSLGLHPLPVQPGTKNSAVNSLEYRTRQPTIEELHKWNWEGGVGVVTTGLIVVDCSDGAEMLLRGWDFFPSWTVRTGAGGLHRYFKAPGGHPGRNVFGLLKEVGKGQVDVWADGFISVPPTRHIETGSPYKWLLPPWFIELADTPAWIDHLVKAPAEPEARLTQAYRIFWRLGEDAPPNARQFALGQVREAEAALPREQVWTILKKASEVWYRETGRCPFCGGPDLHSPTEAMPEGAG